MLKKGKSADSEGWTYELVMNAGKDLEESIFRMINIVVGNSIVPDEWNKMIIKPIDKTNGWLDMNKKRGLFITNIISKIVEKLIFSRRDKEIREGISKFQCGGIKNRGTQDNIFMLNYMIKEYKKERKDLYLLFADIEKYFANLWLKDCIVELSDCKVPVEELMYIYKMNEKVKVKVETPVGKTEEFELFEIVKQGTVGGNKLCGTLTDRINRMGHY